MGKKRSFGRGNHKKKFNTYYDDCVNKSREKGQLFIGFVGDNPIIGKTKCKLYCYKSGIYWETTSIEKHLRRDGCSCKACSRERTLNKTRIPEDVMLKKVKDSCEYYGSEFVGWKDGFKGIYSIAIQYCPKHGITWDTTHAKTLIDKVNTGSGCPECKAETLRKHSDNRDDQHIKEFMQTGSFLEGTEFWRSERLTKSGARNYWYYTCPVCSHDEYVQAGLCSGIFEGFVGGLKEGQRSCRCSAGYRWTREQKEYNLTSILENDNIVFIDWKDDHRPNLYCNKCGEKWSPLYYNVISNGNRCPYCNRHKCKDGLYLDRLDERDYLYLIRFTMDNEVFIKVGRSFDIPERMADFPSCYNLDLLSFTTDLHLSIYNKEYDTHCKLKKDGYHYTPKVYFGGSVKECFTTDILDHPEIISTFNL